MINSLDFDYFSYKTTKIVIKSTNRMKYEYNI